MSKDLKSLGLGIGVDKKSPVALSMDDSTLLAQLSVLPDIRKMFWDTFGVLGSTAGFRHLFISSLALCLCLATIFGILTRRADFESSASSAVVVSGTDTPHDPMDLPSVVAMTEPTPARFSSFERALPAPIQFTGQRFSINWRGDMPVLLAHLDMHNTGGLALKNMHVAIDLYDSRGQLLRRVPTDYPVSFAPYGQLSLTVPIVGVPLAVSSIRAVVIAH